MIVQYLQEFRQSCSALLIELQITGKYYDIMQLYA